MLPSKLQYITLEVPVMNASWDYELAETIR